MAGRAKVRVSPAEQANADAIAAVLALPVGAKLAILHQRRPDLFCAFVADLLEVHAGEAERPGPAPMA